MKESMKERRITSVVDKSSDGSRIDEWLSMRFTYRNKDEWRIFIINNQILINNLPVLVDTIIKNGDIVTFIPNIKEPDVDERYSIIYEDDFLLAINKPPNLPSHPSGIYYKNTLWYLLKEKYEHIHFVNRIDRETSGIVLIAKDSTIVQKVVDSITLKKYLVQVHGDFPNELLADGFLYANESIKPDELNKVRKKRIFSYKSPINNQEINNKEASLLENRKRTTIGRVIKATGGIKFENAKTLFKKISYNGELSIISAELFTGRLHQIRATLSSLGYPIVGDKIYGVDESIFIRFINDKVSDDDKKQLRISHQALYASEMKFLHPITHKEIYLKLNISQLRLNDEIRKCLDI